MDYSDLVEIWEHQLSFMDISVGYLASGVVILFLCLLLRRWFTRFVLQRILNFTETTETQWDDLILKALEKPITLVPIVLGLQMLSLMVSLSTEEIAINTQIATTAWFVVGFWILIRMMDVLAIPIESFFAKLTSDNDSIFAEDFTHLIVKISKTVVFIIGAISVLAVWDFNIIPFLSGLGVFGLAFAFGAQDVIKNVFGGLKILMDGTFKRGDWVDVGGNSGGVIQIGIASTKLRMKDQSVLTIPNSTVANANVINYSKREQRRIDMVLGLEYRSTKRQLQNVVNRIRDHLANHPEIADPKDYDNVSQMVHVTSFGASSIDITVSFFTKTGAFSEMRDVLNNLLMDFKGIVEQEKTDFAFPTQTIHIDSQPGSSKDFMDAPAGYQSQSNQPVGEEEKV